MSSGINVITTPGAGSGGSGTPGGSDTNVQFNDGGAFNGEAVFSYDKTNDQLTVPGVTVGQDVIYSGVITPTQLTADVNNYNPAGLATALIIRLDSDATRSISGIAGGAAGRILYLENVGANSIVLLNQGAGSTNTNRFDLFADTTIAKDCGAMIYYDGTDSRWRMVALTGASSVAGADTNVQFNDGGSFGAEAAFTYNKTTNVLTVDNIDAADIDVTGEVTATDVTASNELSAPFLSVVAGGGALFSSPIASEDWATPAQITSNQNNYTGASGTINLLTSDASRNITGLNSGNVRGRIKFIANTGSFNIVLVDNSGSSSAGNRFALNGDLTLAPDTMVILFYDDTNSVWRVLGERTSGSATPAGSDTQIQYNDAGSLGAEAGFTYDKTTDQFTAPGATITQDLIISGDISPSQITANQDNYSPTNLATSTVLRLTSDASRNITGIQGGVDGRILVLLNVGSFNIVLIDDATSTAGNRFQLNGDLTLLPNMGVMLWYDATDSRWRVMSVVMPQPLTVALGGTGVATLADAGVMVGNGTGVVQVVANGADGQVFKAQGGTTDPAWEDDIAAIEFIIDGGGATITTGVKGYLEIPFACTILRSTLLADQSGSIVIDIWKDTYANYPPVDADSITASAPPTISSATKAQDSTLTGWTVTVAAGDILGFNVDSVTTLQRVTLSLRVKKT